MAMSGVKLDDEIVSTFEQDMKLRKKYQYLIYKLNDKQDTIVIEEKGLPENSISWDEFVNKLPKDDCRWAVYDYVAEGKETAKQGHLVFVAWAPDSAKVKSKMLYASSKDAIKKKLNGLAAELQASDTGDLDDDTVISKINKK